MLCEPLPGVMSLRRRLEPRSLPLRLALWWARHGMLLRTPVLRHDWRGAQAQRQNEPPPPS